MKEDPDRTVKEMKWRMIMAEYLEKNLKKVDWIFWEINKWMNECEESRNNNSNMHGKEVKVYEQCDIKTEEFIRANKNNKCEKESGIDGKYGETILTDWTCIMWIFALKGGVH